MKQLVMVTASGEEHGLVNVLTNSVLDDGFKHMKPEHKKELEALKKEDARIVEAEYLNSRGRHERLEKPYCKYPGDPIQMWRFIPGKTYKVPLGLVKEVNDQNKIPLKHSGLLEVDGKEVNADGSPLSKDESGDWLHKFSAVGFS